MKKHLFLTGPIGCGKSTAIGAALGSRLSECSGFLTRRYREPYLHFALERPDGTEKEIFLDFSAGKPKVNLTAFSKADFQGKILVLDEIGGIELLNPEFTAALEAVLRSEVPILGVIKGESSAGKLIDALGLSETYELAVSKLRQQLRNDPNTMIYECTQYDENALQLARQWAEEYLYD